MIDRKNKINDLLNRFKKDGLDGFEQSEMLELLLSFSTPRRDVGEIANRLLERFGCISSIMQARPQALMGVDGVSEYTATLINCVPMVMRQYCRDVVGMEDEEFDSVEKLGAYCTARYFGSTDEVLSVMLLDEDRRLLGMEVIQIGSRTQASVNVEKLSELIFSYQATCFVLVHNHPDGKVEPSEADAVVTEWLSDHFESMGVYMLEHIIVSGHRYMPIKEFLNKELDSDWY